MQRRQGDCGVVASKSGRRQEKEPPIQWVFLPQLTHAWRLYGSSAEDAVFAYTNTEGDDTTGIVPAWPGRGHGQMVPRPMLFALGGEERDQMVAPPAVLDGHLDDLERRTDPANALRGSAGGGAEAVSQVALGHDVHGLVPSPGPLAAGAATGGNPTPPAARARAGRTVVAARRLVCLRRGRLAGGVSADGDQRARPGLRRPRENRTAVVRDDVVAYGDGAALGLSHRTGHGQRTPARAGDAARVAGARLSGRRCGVHRLRLLPTDRGGAAELLVAGGGQRAVVAQARLRRTRGPRLGLRVAGQGAAATAGGAPVNPPGYRQEDGLSGDQCAGPGSAERGERGGVV